MLAAVGVAQTELSQRLWSLPIQRETRSPACRHPRPAVRVLQVQPGELLRWTPAKSGSADAELGGERKPTVPAGRTSRPRIGAGDRSAGVAAVPARRTRPRDTRMPEVGAPPHVATRADIANRYHWVGILRAGRHDYPSSARSSRATPRRARRMVMAVTSREALDGALTAAQAA
jgi:hypothetical protein